MLKQLLIIILIISSQEFVRCYTIFPARYWIVIENDLSSSDLDVDCKNANLMLNLGTQHVSKKSDFNYTLVSSFFKNDLILCYLTWSINHEKQVQISAFQNSRSFINHECGGRHCFWKVDDGGIYLYNIKHKTYNKWGDWPRK
ncbi:hypothetical protein RND81_04G093000 [Saponaria officinalis]|uniref:S-protein homolog n=1 Tax=Saponaria officinalis TaxID=3572 RepID=A0AAW1LHT9_SAPOF